MMTTCEKYGVENDDGDDDEDETVINREARIGSEWHCWKTTCLAGRTRQNRKTSQTRKKKDLRLQIKEFYRISYSAWFGA